MPATNLMADRLRRSYEYATTHKVSDMSVMLDAAREIDRLEQQLADMQAWMKDNSIEC